MTKNIKEIIFATTNYSKVDMLQRVLGSDYVVTSMKNLGIETQTEEDGKTPEQNALKKATALFKITGKPSFAIDFGLYIDGLTDNEQPRDKVKRNVPSRNEEPTDEEVLNYYMSIIKKLGDNVTARWIRAFALVSIQGVFVEEKEIKKTLVSTPSNIVPKGFPLTALQIDPVYHKYESELTDDEKNESHKITDDVLRDFVGRHM